MKPIKFYEALIGILRSGAYQWHEQYFVNQRIASLEAKIKEIENWLDFMEYN